MLQCPLFDCVFFAHCCGMPFLRLFVHPRRVVLPLGMFREITLNRPLMLAFIGLWFIIVSSPLLLRETPHTTEYSFVLTRTTPTTIDTQMGTIHQGRDCDALDGFDEISCETIVSRNVECIWLCACESNCIQRSFHTRTVNPSIRPSTRANRSSWERPASWSTWQHDTTKSDHFDCPLNYRYFKLKTAGTISMPFSSQSQTENRGSAPFDEPPKPSHGPGRWW